MKKLLVLAVITFGAVMATAGDCVWELSFYTSDAQTWISNGAMAMVFAGSDKTDIRNLIATRTGDALKTALEDKILPTTTGTASAKKVRWGSGGGEVATGWIYAELPDDKQVFWMLFSDNAFVADTQMYWTNVSEAESYNLVSYLTLTNSATIAEIQKAYASVPEPGMMALLALGVAGLALRRKLA